MNDLKNKLHQMANGLGLYLEERKEKLDEHINTYTSLLVQR